MKTGTRILFVVFLFFFCVNGFTQDEHLFRKGKKELNVAMFLPLYYENIDELSFNQYNMEESKSRNYKCFSYISFYEGARIALDRLEKEGYKISLHVFDVDEKDLKKTQQALAYPQMKDMDLFVPLVFKEPFALLSDFARQNSIAIVNPMSTDEEILQNEYVFKIQPDLISNAKTIMEYIRQKQKNAQVIVLYEKGVSNAALVDWYKNHIAEYTPSWTILENKKNAAKLVNYLNSSKQNIIINLVSYKGKNDKIFANTLIKKLSSYSAYKISLFSSYDWTEYDGVDFSLMNKIDYHFTLTYLNDYTNPAFVAFVKEYRKHFKTEPDKIYAAMGYDIILYFARALNSKGGGLYLEPNIKDVANMINRFHFTHSDKYPGWQNETTTIYNTNNYKIKSEWSY